MPPIKLKTIGWADRVDLPDFGAFAIPAKVDTGARTSVLHCNHIRLIKKGRRQYVEFCPLDGKFGDEQKTYTLPFHSERRVRNSFGQEENRYIIHTNIILFNETFPIELSLRNRSGMEFPILLGRAFIRKKFVVDVAKKNLSNKKVFILQP